MFHYRQVIKGYCPVIFGSEDGIGSFWSDHNFTIFDWLVIFEKLNSNLLRTREENIIGILPLFCNGQGNFFTAVGYGDYRNGFIVFSYCSLSIASNYKMLFFSKVITSWCLSFDEGIFSGCENKFICFCGARDHCDGIVHIISRECSICTVNF